MVLKTLRMHGFKSFSDPVEINFPGRVTGIIGPNGCGKSNVVDAVRFVLGEQSLRLLRAAKIDDLIFAGNLRRPATSLGEVALVLDNATRWLDIDYPDVEIRRRIQRDGDSKYFLNGTPVRLKDIQKMFMDVGVNKGHYSIIGQNQVQMIVRASPEDRRQFIEEAAGIVSYRQSKKETLRRLDEVQKNLEQAAIFAADYESRMHSLKIQAGRAQKYLEYQTSYRALYLFSAYRRFGTIRQEMDGIEQQLAAKRKDLDTLELAVNDAAAREESLTQDRVRLSDEVTAAENAVRSAESVRAEKDRSVAASEEKLYSLKRSVNEIDIAQMKLYRAIGGSDADGDASAPNIQLRIENLKKEMAVALEQAEHQLDRLRTELTATEQKLAAEEERLDSNRDDIISAHETAAALESTIAALSQSVEEIRTRVEHLAAQSAADDSHRASLESERDAHERKRGECGESQTSAEIAAKEAEQRLESSRDRLNRLRRESAEVEGRYRSISAAEEAREGFSSSVRMVLDRCGKRDEFLGVVRDLLTFESEYSKAVEAALGPKLQHLVVTTGDTVKGILGELSGGLRGRVTFWALDLLPPTVSVPELPALNNSVGWAVSLLKFDEKLRRLFENLLGRTLVVKDMDALLAAAKVVRGISIVTMDGAYYRSGAITAGPTAGAILIGRKQELADTEKRMKEISAQIAVEEESHQRACSEVAAARAASEAAYRRFKDADANHVRVCAAIDSFQRMADDRKRLLESESQQLTQKLSAISETREKFSRAQESAGSPEMDSREVLDDLRKQVQTLRAESDEALTILRKNQDGERDLLRVESEYLELLNRRGAVSAEVNETDSQLTRLKTELADAGRQVETCAESMKARQAELAQTMNDIEQLRAACSDHQRRTQSIRDEIHTHEIRLTALSSERANLRENAMNEMQTDIETLTESPAAPEGFDEAAIQNHTEHLREIQSKMQRLGSVNVNAIEEFNEVSTKHTELTQQMQDLTQARENLKDVLRKTDKICRERFTEVFHRVAVYFQDVTKKLFLGGEGKLILIEGEDLMESGVDIELRPPGKGFTSIASRSGGEQSLAGICFLFSLFMEKPSPFCILDEVDAALDDVNVGRLARLIEEFSEKIQFAIVTHNKITMQSASCLFGATMEEAGITKLISVKMKSAQEAALAAAS